MKVCGRVFVAAGLPNVCLKVCQALLSPLIPGKEKHARTPHMHTHSIFLCQSKPVRGVRLLLHDWMKSKVILFPLPIYKIPGILGFPLSRRGTVAAPGEAGPAGIAQAFVFLLFCFVPSFGFRILTTLMWRIKFVELTTLLQSCAATSAVFAMSLFKFSIQSQCQFKANF